MTFITVEIINTAAAYEGEYFVTVKEKTNLYFYVLVNGIFVYVLYQPN